VRHPVALHRPTHGPDCHQCVLPPCARLSGMWVRLRRHRARRANIRRWCVSSVQWRPGHTTRVCELVRWRTSLLACGRKSGHGPITGPGSADACPSPPAVTHGTARAAAQAVGQRAAGCHSHRWVTCSPPASNSRAAPRPLVRVSSLPHFATVRALARPAMACATSTPQPDPVRHEPSEPARALRR
jgi:hypothetical protein